MIESKGEVVSDFYRQNITRKAIAERWGLDEFVKKQAIVKQYNLCYNKSMAYSKDYRQMILSKLEAGDSYRKLAKEFNISTRTLQNWKVRIENNYPKTRKRKIDLEAL